MMKRFFASLIFVSIVISASSVLAAPTKACIGEVSVLGGSKESTSEMKGILLSMLPARLTTDNVVVVDSPTGADITVSAAYSIIGKAFSLDLTAKDSSGKVVARAFEQGDSPDQLMAAVSKAGKDLSSKIEASFGAKTALAPPVSPPSVSQQNSQDIIRAQPVEKSADGGLAIQRISGTITGFALGQLLPGGDREIFMMEEHRLRLYHQGKGLQEIANIKFPSDRQLLSIDTADLDKDGTVEAYVTIMQHDRLSSEVWQSNGKELVRVAGGLPYFFRSLVLPGGEKKVFAQQMATDVDFFGEIKEVVKNGSAYTVKDGFKLPRFGTIYTFAPFADAAGNRYTAVLNGDRYLIVYSVGGEELWRSSEKFGGSEVYFKRDDMENVRVTGDQFRWVYLEQRMIVTRNGEIIIPQNSSDWAPGKARSYRKSSVFAFAWNGSTMEEKWHTKESQNYLSDLAFDETTNQLYLLNLVKRGGLFSDGASALAVKKVD